MIDGKIIIMNTINYATKIIILYQNRDRHFV